MIPGIIIDPQATKQELENGLGDLLSRIQRDAMIAFQRTQGEDAAQIWEIEPHLSALADYGSYAASMWNRLEELRKQKEPRGGAS